MMGTLEEIKAKIQAAVPDAVIEIVPNGAPSAQHSLLVDREHGLAVARFLRDQPELRLDYASNVTGLDWPETLFQEKVRTRVLVDGVEKEVEQSVERRRPGYLEAVYHLYSMALKHGPLVIRMRTANRDSDTRLPSLTPAWRSAELQEREIYDLFGIVFDGHPDLRRILMWDGFEDHPMRKDYVEPDDYEWEPTPHDEVLERTKEHWPREVKP